MLRVNDIMTKNMECCQPSDSIVEVAKTMNDRGIGSIPICEGDRLVGMVTDRDLVTRGLANKSPEGQIKDIMTTELIEVKPHMSVHEVEAIMADRQVRRLPVVENNRLVGIVSLGDLAAHHQDAKVGCTLEEITQ
ncbi:CBS domain-containing protein [Aquibacillus rhizosphaerae]|uniref:CBS domain-containing protein n=1 Tax=Aquibacillus rhizosphaerae TaxID=3051431 RepID=A0ABT7L1V1_9BACI|nr:CBS domain-containing protein [Aquibacillus sp. LR5S19]MDL4839792.1 CBS domain-containing protein [Aquibacillus sp. LR5S19]